jgi:hypothetical protein
MVGLVGCNGNSVSPKPDLYGRMCGTWVGVLKDSRPTNALVYLFSDSVRVVVEPGASSPTVTMWQLKLQDDGNGDLVGVSPGASWRSITLTDLRLVGSPTEGGNVYAHSEPDSIGGTVPGRPVGDYVFWLGPGNEPAGSGASVFWAGIEYPTGTMALAQH